MDPAIETEALCKSYGKTMAVDGVDLQVARNGVHGFLGPNGAGKTTIIRILATLVRPDSGRARVFGHDVVREADEVRSRIALTGQLATVDADLTGAENLVLLGRLLGHSRAGARERADELLTAFGLTASASVQVKKYSGGMRRRIDIAATIVVRPELIFLDEPTAALDPRSRNQVWGIVRSLVSGGTTVLLTTQYLDEADQLADRISVIDNGRVIAEGSPSTLKASIGAGALHLRVRHLHQRAEARELMHRVLGVEIHTEADPAALTAQIVNPGDAARALVQLESSNIALAQFNLGQPSLDEVFLTLTGHAALPTEVAVGGRA